MRNQACKKEMYGRIKNFLPDRSWRHRAFILMGLLLIILFSLSGPATAQDISSGLGQANPQAQARPHFYDVDREVTIEGQIEDLRFENRYEGKGNFLVLLVKEKSGGELMEVETAPAWFFRTDIHKGEKIRLIGSVTEDSKEGRKLVIARELRIGNQTITLRDRRGFPTWSRGQGRRRGPAW
ncbi:MAG: hypothetical protein QHH43_03595 [Candidatus Saccharicenans sp.]|jgi:hypothetical protein|nr:hypothetical protein [Candidatus Saccharicenans sp.]MDH7574828.1 hypothetical protein [Candidatus Saccharicenans sp.]